jgi:hypothetical protein
VVTQRARACPAILGPVAPGDPGRCAVADPPGHSAAGPPPAARPRPDRRLQAPPGLGVRPRDRRIADQRCSATTLRRRRVVADPPMAGGRSGARVRLVAVSNLSAGRPRPTARSTVSPRWSSPLSCGDVLRSNAGKRGVWGSRFLHTAEATGSIPVTPISTIGIFASRSARCCCTSAARRQYRLGGRPAGAGRGRR